MRELLAWLLIAATLVLGACGRHDFGSGGSDAAGTDAPMADSVAATYASAVMASGPLAYWRFDEAVTPTAYDSSGNEHHGTYAAVVLGRESAVGDGTAVELSDNPAVGINMGDKFGFEGRQPFSVELWAKPGNLSMLVGKVDWDTGQSNYNGWHVYYDRNATTLRRARANIPGPPLATDEFSHVVTTYDGVTAWVYVNGVPGDAFVTTAEMPQTTVPFIIGNAENWARYTGLIDECAVYDRALTPSEIAAHYRIARP